MERGQKVQVTDYKGDKRTGIVVDDLGDLIVVCNESEYSAALAKGRKPFGIGFPRESVKMVKEAARIIGFKRERN